MPESSVRSGETWEGVVVQVDDGPSGRQVVMVRVDRRNGARTVGMKELFADTATWEAT
jgi:hypothetical protein